MTRIIEIFFYFDFKLQIEKYLNPSDFPCMFAKLRFPIPLHDPHYTTLTLLRQFMSRQSMRLLNYHSSGKHYHNFCLFFKTQLHILTSTKDEHRYVSGQLLEFRFKFYFCLSEF